MKIDVIDKSFKKFIDSNQIQKEVKRLAQEIQEQYDLNNLLILSVLNGAFMFTSDLIKHLNELPEISFIKFKSYQGVASGNLIELIGLEADIKNKEVLIVEDIVDTGQTTTLLIEKLKAHHPKKIKVCTMFFKPEPFKGSHFPDHIGIRLNNRFVLGYGMDYNERGRNLVDLYHLITADKQNFMLNIVLFGPPGAGKGTQSERLIEKYNLIHISTGDIFRANMKGETELGLLAKSYIDKGQLVPDEVTINMLKSEIDKHDHPKGFIFDGFPRTEKQASALDSMLEKMNTSISMMLALDVEEEELKERLKKRAEISGRSDDADPKVIQNRIDVYNKETAPVKNFYQGQGKFNAVNGIGSIDDISERLFKAIDTKTPV